MKIQKFAHSKGYPHILHLKTTSIILYDNISPRVLCFMYSSTIDWLLNHDPSIVFQTKRDILQLDEKHWINDRERIKSEGWGSKLLNLQDENGRWGNGLYSPKWISTHYTLQLLRKLGMSTNAKIEVGCKQLIQMETIGKPVHDSPKQDTCVAGMGLSILSHFQLYNELYGDLIKLFQRRHMDDGGWNCDYPRRNPRHSSFHTTLSVIEGLSILKTSFPRFSNQVDTLIKRAIEFLLEHRMFRSHRTGELIHKDFVDISFPPRWKYNILSALDLLRYIDHPYDERMADSIDIIKSKERKGFWGKGRQMSGKRFFMLDPPRTPSAFNTLRAIRVLVKYADLIV